MKCTNMLSLLLIVLLGMNTGLVHANNDTEEELRNDQADAVKYAIIGGVGVVVGAGSVWVSQALIKDEKEKVPKKYAQEILLLKNRNKEREKAFLKVQGSLKQEKKKRVKVEKNEKALKKQIAELQDEVEVVQEHEAHDKLEELYGIYQEMYDILDSEVRSVRKVQEIQRLREEREAELEDIGAYMRNAE